MRDVEDIMSKYEAIMVVDDEFSDTMMNNILSNDLLDYAYLLLEEDPSSELYKEFFKCVDNLNITWENSGFQYKIMLQETQKPETIYKIEESKYREYIVFDTSEWSVSSQTEFLLNIMEEIFRIKNTRKLSYIEEQLERYYQIFCILGNKFIYRSPSSNDTLLSRISFYDMKKYLLGLDVFDK